MDNLNNWQSPSSRIRYRFPSVAATSHREFALRVNRSRMFRKSLVEYCKVTEAQILDVNFVTSESVGFCLAAFPFQVCACCLRHEQPASWLATTPIFTFARVLVHGVHIWSVCVLVWVLLSPALFTLKAAFLPIECPLSNNTCVALLRLRARVGFTSDKFIFQSYLERGDAMALNSLSHPLIDVHRAADAHESMLPWWVVFAPGLLLAPWLLLLPIMFGYDAYKRRHLHRYRARLHWAQQVGHATHVPVHDISEPIGFAFSNARAHATRTHGHTPAHRH